MLYTIAVAQQKLIGSVRIRVRSNQLQELGRQWRDWTTQPDIVQQPPRVYNRRPSKTRKCFFLFAIARSHVDFGKFETFFPFLRLLFWLLFFFSLSHSEEKSLSLSLSLSGLPFFPLHSSCVTAIDQNPASSTSCYLPAILWHNYLIHTSTKCTAAVALYRPRCIWLPIQSPTRTIPTN